YRLSKKKPKPRQGLYNREGEHHALNQGIRDKSQEPRAKNQEVRGMAYELYKGRECGMKHLFFKS
ncbi:MAG: hypothetical protein OEX02_06425, partial [Cyclobacteriaceae bacterium]|nr:hypothetical protein [Cyclobacteriaceae bacterium]